MTKELLDALAVFVQGATSHFSLPTAVQPGDTEQVFRAPEIHKMRLPDSTSYKKIAPYIIVRYLSSKDEQPQGERIRSSATVELIFCVHNPDEEEGALDLVNLIDAVRFRLLREAVIGGKYEVDLGKVETIVYPDEVGQYYGGEIIFNVECPPIEREVDWNAI